MESERREENCRQRGGPRCRPCSRSRLGVSIADICLCLSGQVSAAAAAVVPPSKIDVTDSNKEQVVVHWVCLPPAVLLDKHSPGVAAREG